LIIGVLLCDVGGLHKS